MESCNQGLPGTSILSFEVHSRSATIERISIIRYRCADFASSDRKSEKKDLTCRKVSSRDYVEIVEDLQRKIVQDHNKRKDLHLVI